MTQEKTSVADDALLFQQAMRQVTPIKHDTIKPQQRALNPKPRPRQQEHRQVSDGLSDGYEPMGIETEEALLYKDSGVQSHVIRRLQRGHYSIEGSLDLHGLTAVEARSAVASFMQDCQQMQLRCVRIIHGKGYRSANQSPVLKTKINHWLPQYASVLAFCSAPINDGGAGAVYVLLTDITQ